MVWVRAGAITRPHAGSIRATGSLPISSGAIGSMTRRVVRLGWLSTSMMPP